MSITIYNTHTTTTTTLTNKVIFVSHIYTSDYYINLSTWWSPRDHRRYNYGMDTVHHSQMLDIWVAPLIRLLRSLSLVVMKKRRTRSHRHRKKTMMGRRFDYWHPHRPRELRHTDRCGDRASRRVVGVWKKILFCSFKFKCWADQLILQSVMQRFI